MSTASKKRKLADDTPQKYYGVRAGKTPGVYTSWADCQENTTGFRGAQYKSFLSRKDAADFVAGKSPAGAKPTGDKFYGVAVGRVPGVYEDWSEASAEIKDVKGPKYKKFATRQEAEEFVRSGGKSSGTAVAKKDGENPPAKKAKTAASAESGKKLKEDGALRVWTDGAARGNGKKGAQAGVGVFFGVNDSRNVSEPLEGAQTNQRAELTGIQRALEIAPKNLPLEIITDSNYSINCSTTWYTTWMKNGWRTSTGAEVTNKDLVVEIRKLIDRREATGAKTTFTWIKGHNDDPGNVAADALAVAGSRKARN
ncbi:Ribonuclease H1 [Lachnellula arida]|uniref:Ribonuclease H n=2 Tax=Lachnellula TaxID=47830 RepID=A0A8T9BLS5_9HELO|nr:Ribonuclease H1 [Lachnellula arida]